MLQYKQCTAPFQYLFQKWQGYPENIPRSGVGSSLENSENIRQALEKIVPFLAAELGKDKIRILDAPCGDMTWMPEFLRGRTDVEYTGYDLMPVNIEEAKEKFAEEPWQFSTWDLVRDRLGK